MWLLIHALTSMFSQNHRWIRTWWVITFNVTNACYYSYTVWPPPRIGGANDFPLFRDFRHQKWHYNDVIMGVVSSQITSLTIVYSTVTYTGADQKKTSKLRVTGFYAGNSSETSDFPAQMANNAETFSIWWRHHGKRGFHVGMVLKLHNGHINISAKTS